MPMIEYFHRTISNQDRTLIFYLNATNDVHSFFTFNEESKKSIATDNDYGEKSSNSIVKCYFNNNACFLIEESIFNYLLSNESSLHKFVNSVGCSIFTTTSSSLIKSILSSKKTFLFHHHHKKGLTHPTTYLSSPLLHASKKEVYFSMNYATKSILIIQVNFDIGNVNH